MTVSPVSSQDNAGLAKETFSDLQAHRARDSTTVTSGLRVSSEDIVGHAQETSTDLQAHSTPGSTEDTGYEVGGVFSTPSTSTVTTLSSTIAEETTEQAQGSVDDQQAASTPLPLNQAEPAVNTVESSAVTIGIYPEPSITSREYPRPPPDKPRSSSKVWHYCKQCSQWHG